MKILIGFKSTAATPVLTVPEHVYLAIWEWFGTGKGRAIRFTAGTPEGRREYALTRDAVEYVVAVVPEGQLNVTGEDE